MQEAALTFEGHDFVDKLKSFHFETLHEKGAETTVGVKTPEERILIITTEGNYTVLAGGSKLEVPVVFTEQFRKLL